MANKIYLQLEHVGTVDNIKPSVSVIIPTYQEEQYIGETLAELTRAKEFSETKGIQSELIVADAGNDRTSEIARRFTDRVFKLNHDGVSRARNIGASKAQGNILVFVDADALVSSNTISEVARDFEDEKAAAVVSYVLPDNRHSLSASEKLFFKLDVFFIRHLVKSSRLFVKFYTRGDLIAVRREAFMEVGEFNEKLNVMEITELLEKLSNIGKVKVLSGPVFESGRRIRRYGLIKNYLVWFRNFASYIVSKRPYSKTWEPIR
jgi:glycosyltransferase involved in cell wall biosynthesis